MQAKQILLALLLIPVSVFGQEKVPVKGRIIDQRGESVEYVQVGIPKFQMGTISTADGLFEISVPRDTLQFFHVAYQTGSYMVTGPAEDVVIVLSENELSPAVFIGGNTKEKYLLRAGTRIPGGAGDFYRPDGVAKGYELGSVAKARPPFLVKHVLFSVLSNHVPGCVAAINIYRIEGEPEEFVNILRKPIYVHVALSDEKQDFDVEPEESILLEPGRYFISFSLVDCDRDAVLHFQEIPESERDRSAMHLLVPLYFKSSYQRFSPLGKLIHLPVNIGIAVKGLEYQ